MDDQDTSSIDDSSTIDLDNTSTEFDNELYNRSMDEESSLYSEPGEIVGQNNADNSDGRSESFDDWKTVNGDEDVSDLEAVIDAFNTFWIW